MLSQLLFTKPGPRETWAYNTSATDMALRDALYEKMGVRNAILFLSKEFPSGSARNWIDALRKQMSDQEVSSDGITALVLGRLEDKIASHLALAQ